MLVGRTATARPAGPTAIATAAAATATHPRAGNHFARATWASSLGGGAANTVQ